MTIFALVLMDEIDAHMHPVWQQVLVPRLKQLFPNVQFIATTHSPLIVAGRSRHEILIFRRQPKTKEIIVNRPTHDFRGLRADQILTSPAFGLVGARDIETVEVQQRYRERFLNQHHPSNIELAELRTLGEHPAILSSTVEETLHLEEVARTASHEAGYKLDQKSIEERKAEFLKGQKVTFAVCLTTLRNDTAEIRRKCDLRWLRPLRRVESGSGSCSKQSLRGC